MKTQDNQIRLCWLGNDGWLIGWNGHLIATDLDLFLPERTLPPFAELDMLAERLSWLFITHAHTDHFNPDTIQYLMRRGPCRLVLPESCRQSAEAYTLSDSRILYIEPAAFSLDEQNNPLPFPFAPASIPGLPDWLAAAPYHALHGHLGGSVYAGASLSDCGYLFTIGGKRIFQPGDSVLLQEHLELRDIDALFVSPTEHNMGVTQAARFIEAVQPQQIIVQHFGTYREESGNAFWTRGYVSELRAALPEELRRRFVIPLYATPFPIA